MHMTSLWCLTGLIVGAFAVSILGAAFSIFGLADLFTGAVVSVMIMAAALEFSKFFVAAYLHQAWHRLRFLFKTYLLVSVVVLSLITSMGIFGYLSAAYQESSSKLDTENIKLTSIKTEQARYTAEIDRLNRSIDEIPASRITKKMQARKEAEPVIAELQAKVTKLSAQLTEAELSIVDVKKRVGPLIYIAKAFNIDIDTVVKYLILVFVAVFDPLAICMIIAVSESLESRKRKKEQELAQVIPMQPAQPLQTAPAPTLSDVPTPVVTPLPPMAETPTPPPVEHEDIHMRFAKDKKVI